MREIKFRAWDKEDKRMIIDEQDFIPVKVTNKGVLKLNPHHKENFWEFIDEERFEIMQYTGIKDKNGCEIYEGDILHCIFEDENYIVEWDEIGAGFLFHRINNKKRTGGIDYYEFEDICGSFGFEVIGNIYENPELLEV